MKNKIFIYGIAFVACFLIALLLRTSYISAGFSNAYKAASKLKKPDIYDQVSIAQNNWAYAMQNQGVYMYDAAASNAGGEFPRGSGLTIVFSGGFMIGGLKELSDGTKVPAVSASEPSGGGTSYRPGRITNSGVAYDDLTYESPDGAEQQVYVIDRSASGPDYANWPQDAPRTSSNNPGLIADAQSWTVFNDRNFRELSSYTPNPDAGFGLQVALETFVFNAGPLSNVVYLKFNIANKSNKDVEQTYLSIYMDPDVYNNGVHDIAGVDTVKGLAFVYNSPSGTSSPWAAVGLDYFQGPVVRPADIPENKRTEYVNKFGANKTVLQYDPVENRYIPVTFTDDRFVLGATGFINFKRGEEADNDVEKYNVLKGLNKDGTPLSGTGRDQVYSWPGDPLNPADLANPAKCDPDPDGDDQRILHVSGPFTLKAGETQEVWVGVIGGTSTTSRLNALQQVYDTDVLAQSTFTAGLVAPAPPLIPKISVTGLDGKAVITWQNNAEYTEDKVGEILQIDVAHAYSEDYLKNDFQGYRVYKSRTGLPGSYEMLAQYDLADGITAVVNRSLNQNAVLEIHEIKVGDDTGLQYSYVDEDVINGNTYFYSVTAYDAQPYIANTATMYDHPDFGLIPTPSGLPISLETAQTANVTSVVPMKPAIGKTYDASADTAEHTAGTGDGSVSIELVDPSKVTGHSYRIEFFTLNSADGYADGTIAYRLRDMTTNSLVQFQTRSDNPNTFADESYFDTRIAIPDADQSDEEFNIADGLLISVFGPAPGVNPGGEHVGWEIPSGTRQFTFAGGANAFEFEGFSGALGYDRPVHFFGNESDRYPVQSLKNILIKLAKTDANGNIVDANDENASFGHRYLRNANASPAQPSFAPFIVNASASYAFQDFVKTVPLSIWDVENPDNPRRLALGYLENNVSGGSVDGKYWPPVFSSADNTAGGGPREWLFISDKTYSNTADPELSVNALTTANMPIMYMATWARRNNTGWSTSGTGVDQFRFVHTRPNAIDDVFEFTTTKSSSITEKKSLKKNLKNIRVVPNPYFGRSSYQQSLYDKTIKFTNLPDVCTIRIFTVAGDLVDVINHNASSDNDRVSTNPLDLTFEPNAGYTSTERWSLQNTGNKYIASGMYVALIEAPGIGKTTVKFAVIQEEVEINGLDQR